MSEAVIPLVAVLLGGVLTIAGGYFSTVLAERRREQRQERNLALAFRGEISAILQLLADRHYVELFSEVIAKIEASGEPFHMPTRVRFEYGSVFKSNVDKIGTLSEPLPELLATFYIRMSTVLEDLSGFGEGIFASLSVPELLRTYRGTQALMAGAETSGKEIIAKIDELYGAK